MPPAEVPRLLRVAGGCEEPCGVLAGVDVRPRTVLTGGQLRVQAAPGHSGWEGAHGHRQARVCWSGEVPAVFFGCVRRWGGASRWLLRPGGEPAQQLLAFLVNLQHLDEKAVFVEKRCFGHAGSADLPDLRGMDRCFLL